MCIICTSHTSKTRIAAEMIPEYIMCCECGRTYGPEYRELIRTQQNGLCNCGHQMIPIKEVVADTPIHIKLIEALSKSLEVA